MGAGSSSRERGRTSNSIANASAPPSSRNAPACSAAASTWNPLPGPVRGFGSPSELRCMPDREHPVRIAIVDDHPIFRDGLRRLLESEPGLTVVAEGTDGEDAIRIARVEQPDVLLLDVAMPRLDGVNALSSPHMVPIRVIVLTAALDDRQVMKAIELGARGIVLKESATRLLIDSIRGVMDGKLMLGPDVSSILAHALGRTGERDGRPYGLTAREIEIVRAI